MNELPVSVRPVLKRLARRIAAGHFVEVWPRWAVASLFVAGCITLVFRMFFARAEAFLPWIWFAPVLSLAPAIVICIIRAYRPHEIAALADSLGGGHGTLLALLETGDSLWFDAPAVQNISRLALPRLRLWNRMWPLLPAIAFLMVTILTPQRPAAAPGNGVLADDIAADLKTTLAELKKQDLVTPAEEKKLNEEIERIRKGATTRVDSSSWEAADALREKLAGDISGKRDALKWAEENLARYAAAAQAGSSNSGNPSEELAQAIERLAQLGLLADAPANLQKLLGGKDAAAAGRVRLPTDPASLRKLGEALSAHLAKRGERFNGLARLGKEFGRLDPSEYPEFSYDEHPEQDGEPGVGGITRGRGDAPLTWGKESLNFDRFKAVPLPPGAARSPDDWAPVAVLPGAPKESPEAAGRALAQAYAGVSGQAAWRRTLAPRHQSAVKKYFETSASTNTK